MKTLCALKVRVGLEPGGNADYPNFNVLAAVKDSGAGDWAYYLDSFGGGMHYDSLAGHKEEIADSPTGMQWCMMLVPEDFADQAVAWFDNVTRMTVAECKDFYDNRVAVYQENFTMNERAINNALDVARVTTKMSPADRSKIEDQAERALDPDDDTSGVVRNKDKRWATRAAHRGIILV